MRYLSDDWFVAADEAVRAAAPKAPEPGLTIEQNIEGSARYKVVIARIGAGIFRLDDDDARDPGTDAVFTQTRATAMSIAQGGTDAHQGFLLGRIHFDGAIDVLIERQEALTWLQTVLAPVMAATAFDQ